jgi:hypothetical protein
MSNPNDPAKKSRRYDPLTTLPFFVIILLVYLWQGYVTGSWTRGMSAPHRAMFYISIPLVAGYYIWIGVRSLLRSRESKSDRQS